MKLGASVVKDLIAWNLLQKARNCKFSLTSFPGAKVDFILNRLSGKTLIILSFILELMMLPKWSRPKPQLTQ